MDELSIRTTTIDSERTPLGELVLRRYEAPDGQIGYEVLLEGRFLMAAHGASSERAMANLAFERRGGERR